MGSGPKKPLVIVYHADCIDGAAAAWAVARARGVDAADNQDVEFIPYEHFNAEDSQQRIRDALGPDSELFVVDVALEREFLDELITTGAMRAVHMYDHHKSAAAKYAGYMPPLKTAGVTEIDIRVNAESPSAAKMVWQTLLPEEEAPVVFDMIDKMDGDGHFLKTPEDFAAAAYIDVHDVHSPKSALETMRGLAKASFNEMVRLGIPIDQEQTAKIAMMMENAAHVKVQILPGAEPVTIPLVNGDVRHYGRHVSERLVGLSRQEGGPGIAFAWVMQKNGRVSMSIRTDGSPDASEVAAHLVKTMGVTGGGHARAAAVHFDSLAHFARMMPPEKPSAPAPSQPAP